MSESLAIEGWPVPLDVPGLRISLSTYRDAEVQVINGAVQIELKNYSGVIFLTPKECAADSVSASPASVRNSLAQEATPTKPALAGKGMRGLDCASAARTVRKPRVFLASADDDETQMDDTLGNKSPASSQQADTLSAFDTVHVDADEEGCDEEEDEEDEVPECVADLLREVAVAPHGELRIEAGDAPEKGIFHRIGAGKNPAKLGAVEVSASGVDGWSKPPDALAAGRKGGDGCRATPASAEEHGADAGARFFGFRLHRALELRLEGYALRNGSKDLGTFPQEWVVERRVGGFWEAVAVENTDALDGTKQAVPPPPAPRPRRRAWRAAARRVRCCRPPCRSRNLRRPLRAPR